MIKYITASLKYCVLWIFVMCLYFGKVQAQASTKTTVEEVMRDLTSRIIEKFTIDQLDTLSEASVLQLLRKDERKVLSNAYWQFHVNVPVVVSVMCSENQQSSPFWLLENGFRKTDLKVKNEHYTYAVWQKEQDAGLVTLGVNGFDRHRPVYFVSVKAQSLHQKVNITPVFPTKQHFHAMQKGVFTYHDWDGLVLSEVPAELEGGQLLTTIRGRAREAHIIQQAFRLTATPASEKADQIMLTWQDSPRNSITVSWRTAPRVCHDLIWYWKEGRRDTMKQKAQVKVVEDRMLYNDRYMHRYTAALTNLEPGTRYQYMIEGSSEIHTFQTADGSDDFSFIWFGDTHNDKKWGELLKQSVSNHSENAFYMIAGDLVNTGLNRDDWDQFFQHSGDTFTGKPLMAIPGNHDSQDGLGASLFQDYLPYPHNGFDPLKPGLSYSFSYKNAFYLMIDAASFSVDDQTIWIDQQLASSDATWKFVFVHFPPYNEVEAYPDLVEKWVPLFDKHQVDFVMSGHFHYYNRTYSLKNNVINPQGTIYMTSVATSHTREAKQTNPLIEKRFEQGNIYQHVKIQGGILSMHVYDEKNNLIDTFTIRK